MKTYLLRTPHNNRNFAPIRKLRMKLAIHPDPLSLLTKPCFIPVTISRRTNGIPIPFRFIARLIHIFFRQDGRNGINFKSYLPRSFSFLFPSPASIVRDHARKPKGAKCEELARAAAPDDDGRTRKPSPNFLRKRWRLRLRYISTQEPQAWQ